MEPVPCSLCGYDAPGEDCPHCGRTSREPSLERPLRGVLGGPLVGAVALVRGLQFLFTTPGIKRWLVPPLVGTSVLLGWVLWWLFSGLNRMLDEALADRIELDPSWAWLDGLSEGWGWLKASWVWVVAAAEWTANAGWGLFTAQPLRWLGWFLIGSLAVWYCFSIAYEALAGPFLDEVQSRLEKRWFGADPRSRLERPNDVPTDRCVRLSALSIGLLAVLWALVFWIGLAWWTWIAAALFAPLPAILFDRRYGEWLAWVARIEGRAAWASLQAAILTAVLVVLALPLYFVPFAGYFLFAAVCGFATSVGLLDIAFERRGWSLRQRLRFTRRHLGALVAFGVLSGFLLAVPVLGPVLMVPAASLGGLWLLCRLDKGFLRPEGPSPGT